RGLGLRPLEALCLLGIGMLVGRAGDAGRAQKVLGEAIVLLRSMELRLWLKPAEAELAALTRAQL
ncbi:MAG TPA: hypothetical protein VJX92_04430, partial [Methylomirabilota bacterium]|nr:hypothetical protein [Methylomirabilota bacterium]